MITLFVAFPASTVAYTASQCYPLKINNKIGALFLLWVQDWLPTVSSTQDREYLYLVSRNYLLYSRNFMGILHHLGPAPRRARSWKRPITVCCPPLYSTLTKSVPIFCSPPATFIWIIHGGARAVVSLCSRDTQRSVSFQSALPKAQGLSCPTLREQPCSSVKIHSENRTKRYKVRFSSDQWSNLKKCF